MTTVVVATATEDGRRHPTYIYAFACLLRSLGGDGDDDDDDGGGMLSKDKGKACM